MELQDDRGVGLQEGSRFEHETNLRLTSLRLPHTILEHIAPSRLSDTRTWARHMRLLRPDTSTLPFSVLHYQDCTY